MSRTKTTKQRKIRTAVQQSVRQSKLQLTKQRQLPVASKMFLPSRDVVDAPLAPPIVVPTFRERGARRRAARSARGQLPPIVSATIDPFSEDARDLKYPDPYMGDTGCFDVHQPAVFSTNPAVGVYTDLNMVTVAPNAGQSVFLVTPDPSNLIVNGIVGTKTTGLFANTPSTFYWPNGISYTATAGDKNAFGPGSGVLNQDRPVSNISLLRSMYVAGRLVAGGVKFIGTQNFSTVSGVIHVAPVFVDMSFMTTNNQSTDGVTVTNNEMANGWQPALPAGLSAMSQLPGYKQFPMSALETDELVFTFRRSGPEALDFKPFGTAWGLNDEDSGTLTERAGATTNANSYGHYCLCVYVEGALTSTGGALPASTVLGELEIAMHYECQPNPATTAFTFLGVAAARAGTQLSTRAALDQPLLMAAANNIDGSIPAIRLVDDAGVEETGFMKEVERLWGVATKVVQSLGPAINVIAPLLMGLSL